jgi:uncharacterized protein (DUF302 family)
MNSAAAATRSSASSGHGVHGSVPKQDVAQARVTEAPKAEVFGNLTEVDVQATMKARLGVDGPRHRILGACNPPLAHRALSAELDIGLLMPSNVAVREAADGDLVVRFMHPVAVLQMTDNLEVAAVAQGVRVRLDGCRSALSTAAT